MRKRCWKTVLSAILASAMLFTSVPANLTMTVHAEELGMEDTLVNTTAAEGEIEQENESLTGNEAGEEQNVQNPVGGNVVEPADDGETGDEQQSVKTTTERHKVAGSKVEFTCVVNEITWEQTPGNITGIDVEGQSSDANISWKKLIEDGLKETEEGSGVWTGSLTLNTPGTYDYKFVANVAGGRIYEADPTKTFTIEPQASTEDRMEDITIQVKVDDATLPAELDCFLATGATATTKVEVEYSTTTEADSAGVTVSGAVGAQKISNFNSVLATNGKDGEITLIAKKKDGELSCTVTVQLIENLSHDASVATATPGADQVTFRYFAPKPVTKLVEVKGSWAWGEPTKMEYDVASGYWSATVKMSPDTYPKEYEYGFNVYKTIGGKDEWHVGVWDEEANDYKTSPNSTVTVTEAATEIEKSPFPTVKGREVTFVFDESKYESCAPTAVYVAGTMNGWDGSGKSDQYKLTKSTESGKWELIIKEMAPGSYNYKYVWFDAKGEAHWVKDELNTNPVVGNDGNSQFFVEGLEDLEVEVARGDEKIELPAELQLYGANGRPTLVAVTYAFSAETSAADYKEHIDLNTEQGTISLIGEFPEEIDKFTLTATDADGNKSTVTVNVVDKLYKYTIYYYDEDHCTSEDPTKDAGLWVYSKNVNGTLQEFTGTEEIDGNTWLKAELELSLTDLYIIPRNGAPAEPWVWQDETRHYNNKAGDKETTLYIVFGDLKKIYTEVPRTVKIPKRYLVVEYERNDSIADWNFYTWNSGFGGNVFVPFEDEDEDGIGTAVIPVKQGLESISFCLERAEGEAHWAEKDGDDYTCRMPLDQNVVKVKMKEGQGITYTYPYNTGYEIKGSEGEIDFFYRDDQAFLAGSEGGYDVVNLEVIVPAADGQEASKQSVPMVYDEDEQRYECVLDQLIVGDYYYRYGRQETAESEAEYVLDDFNDLIKTLEETKYSVLEYAISEFDVEVSMQNPTMDYNDNNVLTIKVKAKDQDGKEIEDASELNLVGRATVDLSAVGGGVTEIDPELLQIAIAVKRGTSVGEKILPITVYDQCNNETKTEVKVTVVDRNKGADFDWDEAVIYFAVTDRFFDGNSGNNDAVTGSYDKATNNGANSSYHGGDFAGLTAKLDYLKDLGVNTIWITPIVEQQETANDSTSDDKENKGVTKSWGYHGYWAKDFEKLDRHLGTEEEFSALLDAAHDRGMKVMVDVVLNHSGYGVEDKFNSILKDADGNFIPMIRTDDDVVGGSDQKSSLAGLPDFLTENKEVRDQLVKWQSDWIDKYDIDYYRVDTVKHVDDTTWSAFKNALTLYHPEFKMIGEWAGAGYATDTGALNTGRMDSLLDFDFNNKASDFVMGRISETERFMVSRNSAIDNTATLGAFLGSHDEDGFIYKLSEGGEYNYCTKEEASALALVAASLQMTAKGQVVIYYGEEIGMTGADNYPYQTNRYDFDWQTAENGNATLTHYKKMLAIRNKYSDVLAKGSRATVTADNERGLDVFTRSYGGTTLTVALNITDQAQTYTLGGQTPNMVLVDCYSGALFPIDENGNAVITVPAAADGGTVVLVQDKELQNHPEGMQIRNIPDQTYTGLSIKLPEDALQVYAGTNRLKAGVDYTVSYKNNKAVGTATVTIKGKGNYKDSVTAQFNIVPKNIAADDVVITYNEYVKYNDKEQKPLSKITYNGKKLTTKEYQVKYYKKNDSTPLTGVKEAGEYQMEITATGKNYAGVAKKTIHVVEGKFMNELKITFDSTSVTYAKTSEELETKLGVVVKDGDVVLEKGKDYEVSFPDGIEVGNAKITITAINKETDQKYYGSVTKTFKITGTLLKNVAKVNPTGWVNVAIDPISGKAEQDAGVAVLVQKSSNSPVLTQDDYTVSYSNNTKPGTATVTFTGKGEYTGTLTKTFKVTAIAWKAADLGNDLKVTVSGTVPFSKKGAQPAVTVTYRGKNLTAGKDYKVTYNNNKAVTTASTATNKKPSVTITGMGMFSGAIKNAAEFTIEKANLETAGITVTVRDAVYSEQKESLKSKPVVKEADGTILVMGSNKDYTVTYQAKVNNQWVDLDEPDAVLSAGDSIKVVVEAVPSSNYEGSTYKEYKIVKASILNATIIAKAQTYTGKAITLDENDISKARIGKKNLTYGVDYVIVSDSYEKNVNKGNATVTIKGIGDYGDEKKITFRITSSGMRWWWNLFS